jgi:predicted  nucleic acid-binding Zn-ribbon protein
MRQTVEQLLALQKLTLDTEPLTSEAEAEIRRLRDQVPAPVLGHFDRLVSRGKRAVAIVRHGVCGECHLRVSSGTLASLAYGADLHLCDHCGRYLLLPADEPIQPLADVSPPAKQSKKPSARRGRRPGQVLTA